MAAQDRNGRYTHQQGSSVVELSFDGVARGLADETISRRKALRMLGGALLGSALASIPGVAWAARGGNRVCMKFCKQTYPPGPERAQCISGSMRGEGPCFTRPGCPCPVIASAAGECPPGTHFVSEEAFCDPEAGECGCMCVRNRCMGTVTCACCRTGGPCPCIEFDPTDPCTDVIRGGWGADASGTCATCQGGGCIINMCVPDA
jgi:hypothetical protein